MAKVNKARQLKACYRKLHVRPNQTPRRAHAAKDIFTKKHHRKTSVKKDWEDAICSVCMESPHNAVLLLCSSHGKGCRPYMCATSCRFSNCLDQYKKAYTKLTSLEVPQLSCPICRGQVKGWTVVEPARKHLNTKKRSCMQDKCSFGGSYKELRRHVKAEHPLSRPRDVDPAREEKWRSLERERERNDVISAITSAEPGAVVFGDFVIEPGQNPFYRSFDHVGGFLDENYFRIDPFLTRRLGLIAERRTGRVRGSREDSTSGDDSDSEAD